MTKEFNNFKKLKPYYDEKTNTYIFKKNGKRIDVKFNFNLMIEANIVARNIDARNIDAFNIDALNINACDITANDIKAWNISFYGLCFSYESIKCNSIKARRKNHIMKALDGEIFVKGESK